MTQLVLSKYGSALRCKNGMFFITHKEGNISVPVHEIKSIHLGKSVHISSNALFTALASNIDVVMVEKNGFPAGRLWNNKFGSTASVRQQQIRFISSSHSLLWVKEILCSKIESQTVVLISLYQHSHADDKMIQSSVQSLEEYKSKIEAISQDKIRKKTLATLRGWEGNCSKIYFRTVSAHLPEMYQFQKRSQHPAMDYFNAALNYAYGMLYSIIEGALIKAGLDPSLGILHEPIHNNPVLTYDVIEKYRYWADYVVIQLCKQQVLLPDFFVKNEEGGVYLDGDGKRILIQSFNEYLAEVVDIDTYERSRLIQIEQYAHRLATLIKEYKK